MTMNESYSEYLRQIETIRKNNLQSQKNANKHSLFAAAIAVTFVASMLILNYFNIIHLS
jgi:hypothetical protein